jgi:autotransporter-associated beta strand protein
MLLAFVCAVGCLAAPSLAVAQTSGTWASASGGTWGTTGNWSGGFVASGTGANANFATLDITGTQTVTLDTAYTLGSLSFGDTTTSSTGSWRISNGGTIGNTLTLNAGSGTTPVITVSGMGGGRAIIDARLTGTSGFILNDTNTPNPGTLVLSGSNGFTGNVTVNSGTLAFQNTGTTAFALTGWTGGTLQLNAAGFSVAAGANSSFTRAVILGTGTSTVSNAGTSQFTLSGIISGVGALRTGSSTAPIALSGANTFSGGMIVGAGVNLYLNNAGAGTPNAPTSGVFGTGTVTLAGGSMRNLTSSPTVTINNVVNVTADTSFPDSTGTTSTVFTGSMTLVGGTRTFTADQFLTAFNGPISDGGSGLGLTKAGGKTLALGGSNSYTGATTLNSGTLRLDNQDALRNSTLSMSGTGSLRFSSTVAANAFTFGGLSASSTAATLSLSNTAGTAITLTVGGNDASTSYAGSLTGGGSLAKTGAGVLTLSGSNSYAGTTTVSQGMLSISSTASLPGYDTGGRYSVATGAGLAVGNAIDDAAVATILATGNIASGAAFGFNTSLGDRTYSAALSGGIGLVKAGGNTLTLSASNGYTGTTTLAGGTLALGDANALAGGGDVTFSGGVLRYTASNQADLAGRIASSGSAVLIDTNGQSVAWAGNLAASNSAGLNKLGSGTLTLSGSNAYGGTTTLAGGALTLGSADALSASGTITFSGGLLQYTASNTTDYTARIASSGSAVAIDTNGQAVTFTGGIDATNTGGLRKLGAGTLTLSGSSGYSGTTTLAGGALALGNANSLPASGNITFTGGSLRYSASNTSDLASRIVSSTSAVAIDTAGQDVTFAGNLVAGNTAGLTKQGAGTLTLSGSNTFTGPITVSAGTLALNGANVVPSSANAFVLDGGVLLRSSTTVPTLLNAFQVGTAGGELRNGTANSWTLSGAISGTGGLVLSSAGGDFVIGNVSTSYTGGTRILANTLVAVSTNIALGSGTISFEGGSMRTTSGGAIVLANPVSFAGGATFNTAQKDLTFTGPGTIVGATSTITVSSTTSLATYAGSIGDGGNTLGFTKAGVGTLILGGSNTYSGTTTLSAGTLRLNNADAFAGGGNLSFTGGTLQYTGSNTGDYSARIRSSSAAIRIDTNSQAVTWSGAVDSTNVGGLAKSGSGTLVLAAANTYSGTTTVSGGTLQIGNGGTAGSIAGNVALSNTAALVFNRSNDLTYAGAISGTGSLTKSGAGALTLSGTSTLATGAAITINGGALVTLSSNSLNSGAATFAFTIDSGTLANSGTSTSGISNKLASLSIGSGGATIRSDARFDSTAVYSGTSATASLTYGTMSGTVSNVFMIIGGSNTYAGGTRIETGVDLVVDNNSAFGTGTLELAGARIRSRQQGTSPPRTLANAVTISADTMFFGGSADPNLTFTGATTLSGGTRMLQVDSLITSATSAGQPGVIFSNAIGDGGNGYGVTKTGAGVLALGGANTYTGLTTLSAGTIQLQHQAALQNSTLALSGTGGVVFDAVVAGNAFALGGLSAASASAGLSLQNSAANAIALTVGGNNASTAYAGLLTGAGSLVKTGSGTLTLGGANTYAGTTTVAAGSLLVNGNQSAAAGAVLVDALATLGGSGTIGGAVTVNGFLSPGNSPGVLTVASLDLGGSSTSLFEIDGLVRGTQYDGVNVSTIGGTTYGGILSLVFGNGAAFADNTTFDLFQFTGSPSGSFSSVTSSGFYAGSWTNNNDGTFKLEQGGQTLTFSQSSGDIVVVPEPAALALAGIGAGVAGWNLIRRRRRPA